MTKAPVGRNELGAPVHEDMPDALGGGGLDRLLPRLGNLIPDSDGGTVQKLANERHLWHTTGVPKREAKPPIMDERERG